MYGICTEATLGAVLAIKLTSVVDRSCIWLDEVGLLMGPPDSLTLDVGTARTAIY